MGAASRTANRPCAAGGGGRHHPHDAVAGAGSAGRGGVYRRGSAAGVGIGFSLPNTHETLQMQWFAQF